MQGANKDVTLSKFCFHGITWSAYIGQKVFLRGGNKRYLTSLIQNPCKEYSSQNKGNQLIFYHAHLKAIADFSDFVDNFPAPAGPHLFLKIFQFLQVPPVSFAQAKVMFKSFDPPFPIPPLVGNTSHHSLWSLAFPITGIHLHQFVCVWSHQLKGPIENSRP